MPQGEEEPTILAQLQFLNRIQEALYQNQFNQTKLIQELEVAQRCENSKIQVLERDLQAMALEVSTLKREDMEYSKCRTKLSHSLRLRIVASLELEDPFLLERYV